MKQTQTPKFAKKFLLSFLKEELAEEVLGDLEEKFSQTVKSYSLFRARLQYWMQVVRYVRPFAIKKFPILNPFIMYRHNLLISLRNILKYKTTFFINLIGLTSGLACVLLIYLWVSSELQVDNFYEDDERLFQVLQRQETAGVINVFQSTPWPLFETLADEYPEVEAVTVATPPDWFDNLTVSLEDKDITATGIYAGTEYFNIFSYPLIYGDRNKVLQDKNSVVISRELAKQLFNTADNAIGKDIQLQNETVYKIAGIFEDLPRQASTQFDLVLSIEILREMRPNAFDWKNSGPDTYVKLKKGANWHNFEEAIANLIESKTQQTHRSLLLKQYSRNYLYGKYENGTEAGGRIEYVILFSTIALFILLIACINFMNLATARATRRLKEVGVKKAIGARRSSLVMQYLIESTLIAFTALLLSIITVYLLLPEFNVITEKQLSLQLDWPLFLSLCSITLITGLLAGSYPAIYLSSFKPAAILKGKINTNIGELWTRKGLVVFQFAISIVFIISVSVVYKQIEFVQKKNIGYNKDNVIYFTRSGTLKQSLEPFLVEASRIPGVISASSVGQSMVGGGNTSPLEWEGKDPEVVISFAYRPVNYGALEMLEVELKEGRLFSREFSDSLKVIFNEAGIAAMGLQDPLGKRVGFGPFQCEIVGVVKDFHFKSLHSAIDPLFFILVPPFTEKIITKIQSGKEAESLKMLEDLHNQFNPGFPFDYRFLDQDYQAQYASEQRVSTLSKYFAGLAILISCLGLLGLAAFTVERRQKEIGIRKVMGSTEFDIIYLLTNDFTKIVLLAIVIAIPISYLMAQQWLSAFAYRIELQPWIFAGSGFLVLLVAWFIVGTQAIKAARQSPSQYLKAE
ncbi:MAG: ABC transporter permease [Cyclobacteriaceae bacterium]